MEMSNVLHSMQIGEQKQQQQQQQRAQVLTWNTSTTSLSLSVISPGMVVGRFLLLFR